MLNKNQQAVIDSEAKHLTILAGPGTGKTHTISYRIQQDIENGVLPLEMVIITFTRNAANELRERLLKLIGFSANEMFIGTIHSFYLEIVDKFIEEANREHGYSLFDQEDKADIMEFVARKNGFVKKGESVATVLKDEYRRVDILREYEFQMQLFNAIDLDMIIEKMAKLVYIPKVQDYLEARYNAYYVDEFQDTTGQQVEILKQINPKRLVVIGDPDQSIYEWNGAVPETLVNISTHFPEMEMHVLEENYRSGAEVVDFANKLISYNENRVVKKIIALDKPSTVMSDIENKNADEEFESIVNMIPSKGVAIICRKNATAKSVHEYLEMKHIKATLKTSSGDILSSDMGKSLISIILATVNNKDNYSLMKALIFLGIDKEMIFGLFNQASNENKALSDCVYGQCEHLNTEIELILTYANKINLTSVYDFASSLFTSLNIRSMFAKQHRISKITEIDAFLEYIQEWERKKERKFQSSSVAAFVKYVRLRDLAYREKRDNEDDAIQIMTVHGAKGLEFDTVIIPHSFEGEFPMTMKTSNIEEERRLFYVAATRAISKLIITSCMQKKLPTGIRFNTEVSRFLEEGGLQ